MSWLHAHFDRKTALHAILNLDAARDDIMLTLAHGYVLEDGVLIGLAGGGGTVRRGPDRFARRVALAFTDARGTWHELEAASLTSFPWQCWPNMVAFNCLARWHYRGREGYGEIQDFYELPQITGLNAGRAAPAGEWAECD